MLHFLQLRSAYLRDISFDVATYISLANYKDTAAHFLTKQSGFCILKGGCNNVSSRGRYLNVPSNEESKGVKIDNV
jgi:hypothetical protein